MHRDQRHEANVTIVPHTSGREKGPDVVEFRQLKTTQAFSKMEKKVPKNDAFSTGEVDKIRHLL